MAYNKEYETTGYKFRNPYSLESCIEWGKKIQRREIAAISRGANLIYNKQIVNGGESKDIEILETDGIYGLFLNGKMIKRGSLADCVSTGRTFGFIGNDEIVRDKNRRK